MKNLKKKVIDISKMLKKEITRCPLTILTIIIITIIYALTIENEIIKEQTLENIIIFGIIFSPSTFLIETTYNNRKSNKTILYILAFLLSIIFVYLINIKTKVFGLPNYIFTHYLIRIITCYVISLSILSIYKNYKNSKKQLNKYLAHVFSNLFKTSIVYSILSLGATIITSIFISLILTDADYTLLMRVQLLLLGCYYIPALIKSFQKNDSEISGFYKFVIKYILESLIIVAFLIIYIYIFKIIILREIPSNQIFRILSFLFILGCPIWTMTSAFKEENILDKINKKLPLLFAPFILLQLYSLGIRILNHGLTEIRYIGLILIIIEIIYIIFIIKKKKLENMMLIITVTVIISLLAPYINMYKLSQLSQYHNLKIYKEKSTLTKKDKQKIYGAYKYLNKELTKEKYINTYLTEQDINKILKFNTTSTTRINEDITYIYSNISLDKIDIENYSIIYKVTSSVNYNTYNPTSQFDIDHFKNTTFTTKNTQEKFKVDISKEIKNYIEQEKNINNYLKTNNIIETTSGKLILENVSINYNTQTKKVEKYKISGYYLTK